MAKVRHAETPKEANYLKEIGGEIGNLLNLKVLSFGNNLLEELPEEIGDLKHLKEL